MTITVFLVDDHAVLRDGLRALLETQPDLHVIGEAASGHEAVHQVAALRPDVVIMDIALPDLNGIDATQQIREACPWTQVVILSMHSSGEHLARAVQAGAQGYVLKESAGSEVIAAVRAVHQGRRFLSYRLAMRAEETDAASPLARLSSRERQVLQLVVEGKTSAEIAEVLFLSPKTVETYRSRLMQKLGVNDLASLIRFAISQGLTPLQ